jgi:hypothetical protein
VATAAVLPGLLAGHFFSVSIDGWVGLAVSAFILKAGWGAMKDTIDPLLGKPADPELVRSIEQTILAHDTISGIHDLVIHDYGPGRCFASIHAEVSARLDPMEVHDILDDIECEAMKKLNVHLVIHYDPVLPDDAEWTEMSNMMGEIIKEVAPEVTMHCFRMVGGAKQKNLVFDLMVPYDSEKTNHDLKKEIDAQLAARNKKYGTVIRFDGKE